MIYSLKKIPVLQKQKSSKKHKNIYSASVYTNTGQKVNYKSTLCISQSKIVKVLLIHLSYKYPTERQKIGLKLIEHTILGILN